MKHIVLASETRRTETPNAVMTTLGSPTLGGSEGLSMWTVEMEADAQGPLHRFDREQVWSVQSGAVNFSVDGTDRKLSDGDSIVLPAGALRQVRAIGPSTMVVCGLADAVVSVEGEELPRGVPGWIA